LRRGPVDGTDGAVAASAREGHRMPLMEWDDKLSVRIAAMDEQHQKLVALLNELFDAMMAGQGRDRLGHVTGALVDYTKTHFSQEEELMAQHGYPDLAAHRAAHEALTKKVLEAQQRYRAGASAALSIDMLNFLKSWLVNHIQGTDKKYGVWLSGKGVR
jgi:hemerythrin